MENSIRCSVVIGRFFFWVVFLGTVSSFVFGYLLRRVRYKASIAAATAKPAPMSGLVAPLPPSPLVVEGCELSVLLWVLPEVCDADVALPDEPEADDSAEVVLPRRPEEVTEERVVGTVMELTRSVVVPDVEPDVTVAELRMSEILLRALDGMSVTEIGRME